MDDGKIISFRMPAAEVDAFWKRAPRRRGTEILAGMVRAYLCGTADDEVPEVELAGPGAQYPAEHREWHQKLEDILSSGDEKTIDAVIPNIEVFHERLRPQRKASAGKHRAAVNE